MHRSLRPLRIQALALLLPAAALLSCNAEDEPGTMQEGDDTAAAPIDPFTVVVLPDTQAYSTNFPETFSAQTRWIAEHQDELNIVFVTHVGDVVNAANRPAEWEAAQAAYDWIEDAGVPHGFSVGSHDFARYGQTDHNVCSSFEHLDCDFTDFIENFGPQRYEGRDWFVGSSPSGKSTAQRVSAGGLDLLFVHLPHDTPRPEVEWAHEVLDANADALAHITTHRYLFDYRLTDAMPSPLNLLSSGRFNEVIYLLGGQDLLFDDALTANQLFEELVATHPNVWGVHCGHVDAEFHQVSENTAGLPVYEVLTDFQNMSDGGGGWLRLLTFYPSEDRIHVQTYSPTADAFRSNGDGFDHSIGILEAYLDDALEYLEALGLDREELEAQIAALRTDSPERDEYYDSLYGEGQRDSDFELSVDFQAYLDAAR